jgi:two-component system response regulator AtoC
LGSVCAYGSNSTHCHPVRQTAEAEIVTRTVRQRRSQESLSLIVGSAAGASIVPLDEASAVVLGRSSECDIVINDESVSRKHSVLRLGVQPTIEDLGSRNGTVVQGRRLQPAEPCPIALESLLQLGSAWVVLQRASAVAQQANDKGRLPPVSDAARWVTGSDPVMLGLYEMLGVVAPSNLPVLLLGETGVGKEVFASLVHARSRRRSGPFVAVNCGAIPAGLIETELFGHVKGAFSGATETRGGLFEAADRGTLFLDEIGELPLAMQPKLLRVLETGEIGRVGSTQRRVVDVRIVSATNQDLPALAAKGAFRSDVYFRLNGVTVNIPPLRSRRADIAPLAEHFVQLAATRHGRRPMKLAAETILALEAYEWPGNVRELRSTVERAVVLCPGLTLALSHLMLGAGGSRPSALGSSATLSQDPSRSADVSSGLRAQIESFERRRLLEALEITGGNQTQAARLLCVGRRTLIDKLKMHGIERPRKGKA